jgi:hypothetical protein
MITENEYLKAREKKQSKIEVAITTLSRLQIQLINVGLSNEDYNDISEMIGNIKERLANITAKNK